MGKRSSFERREADFYPTPRAAVLPLIPYLRGIKAFAERFQKEYGYKPDHNGLKGYTAMYIVRAVTEKIGKVDPKAFANAMHGVRLSAKEYPGVLMDVSFDKNGDLDRESFMTKVVNGKQEVIAVLPAASAQ